ncbi:Activating signal cointegrator 1 complex subunit 2 [Gryllus bimaculatus]|nr:Activating signal cointegrator 1 complex subunit 2 [Gryllus bimaculatus]
MNNQVNGIGNEEVAVPMEKKKFHLIEDGVKKEFPALHRKWVVDRYYLPYCPPPQKVDGSFVLGAKENWLEQIGIFCQDMKWLLQLQQHQFWSQALYDNSTMAAVVSFLQEAVPYHALNDFPNDEEMWQAYEEAYRLVFLVICRLATNEESKVFQSVSQCVGLKMPLDSEPERITAREGQLTSAVLSDVILHILDTTCTLSVLTDVFLPASKIFHQNNFEVKLVWFYENVIPELYNKLEMLINVDEEPVLFISLKNKLDLTRVELLKIFRNTLFCNINSAIESGDSSEVMNSVDDYVTILTECLAEKLFVSDYHRKFSVAQDLDLLAQLTPDMDADKRSYILEAVIDSVESNDEVNFPPPPSLQLPSRFGGFGNQSHQTENGQPSTSSSNIQENASASQLPVKKVTGIKLDSLISQVKDILPHLGDGFIEQCLEHYNYVTEDVINAILESKLPPHLSEMDQDLPRIPPEKEPSVPTVEISIVSDEEEEPKFAEAHKGKRKGMYRDVMMLLNDKTHREDMREFYSPFSLYEDEYDDTYDDRLDVTLGDDDDPERNNNTAQENHSRAAAAASASEDEEDSDEGPSADHFVMNPERVRALQEQRRLARGHRGPPRRDVVGKPKGQGQDKNVVINRNQKNTHKAQHGNHNRRRGAQRKLAQGMIPS